MIPPIKLSDFTFLTVDWLLVVSKLWFKTLRKYFLQNFRFWILKSTCELEDWLYQINVIKTKVTSKTFPISQLQSTNGKICINWKKIWRCVFLVKRIVLVVTGLIFCIKIAQKNTEVPNNCCLLIFMSTLPEIGVSEKTAVCYDQHVQQFQIWKINDSSVLCLTYISLKYF